MKEDIFDLNRLDDIPEKISHEIKSSRGSFFRRDSLEILSLFDLKNPLLIDEIQVGAYRKFNILIQKNVLRSRLYNWCHLKILSRKRNEYTLNKEMLKEHIG